MESYSVSKARRYIERGCFIADLRYAELDTFSGETDVMWRGFVISVIAAVSLQYVDPFGTKKLVLFGVGEEFIGVCTC